MEQLILDLFNINPNDIESIKTVNDKENGIIHVYLKLKKVIEILLCPECGNRLIGNGTVTKLINHQALYKRKLVIHLEVHRLRCKKCGYSTYERNPLVNSGFNNSILTVNQVMIDLHDYRYNYTMIAQNNSISVNQVITYFDSYVVIPKIELPTNLGIDEIHSDMANRKNASYLCTLTDNDDFKLIDILSSRSKYELALFFENYSLEERQKVKYVTIDMWEPYKEIVLKWLPNVIVAVDPFHVIKHLMDCFRRIRIKVMNKCAYNSPSYYLLKHWHKLLESNTYKLDGEPKYNHIFKCNLNYGDLLKMTLDLNEELNLAYELKEAYINFNSHSTYETASNDLDELISMFQKANIKEYEEFTNIMITWKQEIINSFIVSEVTGDRLSNAKSEAMNEKIKTHIRISKGLANFLRFRKRMLYCFNDKLFVLLTNKLTSLKRNLKKKDNKDTNK